MRTQIFFLFCLLCGLIATAKAQTGIIGINTLNPQGVLHIDGGEAGPSDDVIVDAQGRIGLGLLNPETRMDILPSATAGSIIRIQDGTEGEGKFLFSDGNGVGSWAPLATGSWYAALYDSPLLGYANTTGTRPFTNYAHSVVSSTYQGLGGVSKSNGSITLPATGKYRITLSIYWIADGSNNRTAPYKTQAILRRNYTEDHTTFNFWAGILGYGVLPTFSNILEFQAGDVLTLVADESQAAYANNAQAVLFMVELLL
jgi:hypothetical protein